MDNGYTLSDVAAATGNGGFGGMGSEGIWIFALLILLFGGNWGNNANNLMGQRVATQADIQRAVDFDTLKSSIAGVNETVITTGTNTVSAVKDNAYNQLGELRDIQNQLNSGFSEMQKCCCETQRSIDGVNYNVATQSAAIQANDTANTQKILDAICTNRMADMQNQINQLQLQNAMAGVVKYPMQTTYGIGMNPYCNCNSLATV